VKRLIINHFILLEVGHFYFPQIGHYHFRATPINKLAGTHFFVNTVYSLMDTKLVVNS